MRDLSEKLDCLYTDLAMLSDESWVPDTDSCEASLTVLEGIVEDLKAVGALDSAYKPKDTRQDEESEVVPFEHTPEAQKVLDDYQRRWDGADVYLTELVAEGRLTRPEAERFLDSAYDMELKGEDDKTIEAEISQAVEEYLAQ